MGSKEEGRRRPLRFLLRLAVFGGIVTAVVRFLATKKEEYAGLTESEARERMQAKLTPRFGEDKAKEITDQVIPVLADRGIFRPESEAAPSTPDEPADIEADAEG
ncbi:MAG: hypothetical protein DIU67_006105 [Actinomycetes bacterium]|jgi:hypothetical protein|nr:MAG: hypothetical protein DIU67_03020 [Actinomycetota bacterium]